MYLEYCVFPLTSTVFGIRLKSKRAFQSHDVILAAFNQLFT